MTDDVSATALRDRIGEFTAAMAKNAPPEVIAALGAETRKLAESGIAQRALGVGAKAPDFSPNSSRSRRKRPTTRSPMLRRRNLRSPC